MAKKQQRNVRFVRIRGRIVPIKNKNARAAKDIVSKKNTGSLLKIGAATIASLGGLFAAGRVERKSQSLFKANKSLGFASKLNRSAKFLKFGAKALPALVVGTELIKIDRKSKDEGTLFDIGNKSGAANTAIAIGVGFAAARFGKRFEKFGLRGGKFPIKLKDI